MKKNPFKVFLVISGVILLFLLIFLSPLFNIASVNIEGNVHLTEDYIEETTGLNPYPNLFTFSSSKAESALKENTYVEDVKVDKKYFKKNVSIELNERTHSGYVEHETGTYLYIDEDGRVLETSSQITKKLPIIIGLEFDTFTVGEILQVENQETFDDLVILTHIFNKYEISEEIVRVDLSDVNDIHLFVDGIDVSIGTIDDADEKILIAKTSFEAVEYTGIKGFLDVSDINKDPVFRKLT